jgi:hypothetical protein
MKGFLYMAIAIVIFAGIVTQPVLGQEMFKSLYPHSQKTTARGDAIIFDMVLLRPFGILACGLGIAASAAATPFALTSRSENEVLKGLVAEPLGYTFRRPLGDLDNQYQSK